MNSTNSSGCGARVLRVAVAVFVSMLAASLQAAGIKSERVLASILRETPKPELVMRGQEMARAEAPAGELPGAAAFWGVGESMDPLYSSHTAIVVAPMKFKALKKGMTVVYIIGRGRMVAH